MALQTINQTRLQALADHYDAEVEWEQFTNGNVGWTITVGEDVRNEGYGVAALLTSEVAKEVLAADACTLLECMVNGKGLGDLATLRSQQQSEMQTLLEPGG